MLNIFSLHVISQSGNFYSAFYFPNLCDTKFLRNDDINKNDCYISRQVLTPIVLGMTVLIKMNVIILKKREDEQKTGDHMSSSKYLPSYFIQISFR